MNKVILMGRLVRDPEVRYSQGHEPLAVARYTLAVDRKFQKANGQNREADFIGCVAFGKAGEFAEKYLKKGQMVGVVGHLNVRSWDDNEGKKRWTTEVIVDEHHFCGSSKNSSGGTSGATSSSQGGGQAPADGLYPIDESIEDDDLPF